MDLGPFNNFGRQFGRSLPQYNHFLPQSQFTRPTPKFVPLPESVGKGRQITHNLTIGGHSGFYFTGWSKDQMSYSAGDTCTINLPHFQPALPVTGPQLPGQTKNSPYKGNGYYLDLFSLASENRYLPVSLSTVVSQDGKVIHSGEEFYGVIDTIDLNMETGMYNLNVRSLAQIFLDQKVTSIFTASSFTPTSISQASTSQVLRQLALRYGPPNMQLSIDKGFDTPIGAPFSKYLVRALTNLTVWDIFESFAKFDNASLYVSGNTLYYTHYPSTVAAALFSDITQISGKPPTSYTFTWKKNILAMDIRHSPLMAHDITVEVKAVDFMQKFVGLTRGAYIDSNKAQINAAAALAEHHPDIAEKMLGAITAPLQINRLHDKPFGGSGMVKFTNIKPNAKMNYVFHLYGSTQAADDIATKIAEDIASREYIVTVTVLGQPDFNPRQLIKIVGTHTAADQVYAIKNIHTESMIPDQGGNATGYVTTFDLVNHAVATLGSSV